MATMLFGLYCALLTLAAATPTADEQAALTRLTAEVRGRLLYGRGNHLWVTELGSAEARDLGVGSAGRWSADGRRIVVHHQRKLYVMNADGSDRRLVTDRTDPDNLDYIRGCQIAFHPNGAEIVGRHAGRTGMWAFDIVSGVARALATGRDYDSEPSFDAVGRRLVVGGQGRVYALDLTTGEEREVAEGCGSSIAPDGSLVAANQPGHRTMIVRDWATWTPRTIVCRLSADQHWDDHHWSNHPDLLCVMGHDGPQEGYVVRLSTGEATRVTFVGQINNPDLFVDAPE